MNMCFAVGVTANGDELRCCLDRSHRDKTDHWDSIRNQYWNVDLAANPWALSVARA